jgi:3-phenylpropionate/cinnamic acid dioxygenase small subunit
VTRGLSVGDEIRNLLGRYCELIDAADFDGVGALFASASIADEHGTVLATGAEAIAAFYANTVELHDGSPRTKHLVVDTIVEMDTDTTARARSSYVVLQAVDEAAPQVIITGRYDDRFASGAAPSDGWHFIERRFFVDQVGDLSRHLKYELPT